MRLLWYRLRAFAASLRFLWQMSSTNVDVILILTYENKTAFVTRKPSITFFGTETGDILAQVLANHMPESASQQAH